MRALRLLPLLALAECAAPAIMCQVAYPPFVIQNASWNNGQHHETVTNRILSPASPSSPLSIEAAADAEFISASQVHLMDGFHAGAFTSAGHFRAYIDEGLGDPGDIITIAPDPGSSILDSVIHVPKWEKFEIGLRLPNDYQDAIDRFFAHYYAHGLDSSATPHLVDPDHDLNPYADDSLVLVMRLTDPTGNQRMKWGFFMREARWSSNDPTAYLVENDTSALHDYSIRFRFAPDTEGTWQLSLALEAPNTQTLSNVSLPASHHSGYDFTCGPPLLDNKGYLHVNTVNRRMLQFDNGESFFGLGTNLADRASGPEEHQFIQKDFSLMQQAMGQLHSVGGNFLRMFLMRNSFAPEWVNLGVYDRFVYRRTSSCEYLTPCFGNGQHQSWAFDRMLDHARANNMYIQLCIDPYPPILAYETIIWHAHPYALNFLEQLRDTATGTWDMKRFFYSLDTNAQPDHDHGVFYYWKRKYKYIMARWGYSVNIAAIEPFNETDQLLTYKHNNLSVGNPNDICPDNKVDWLPDTALPATVNSWVGDIADFVRLPVDTTQPSNSPLGENNKLFLVSYTDTYEPSNTTFYRPFSNPKVDINDLHHGIWGTTPDGLVNSFDLSRDFRDQDQYAPSGNKKPFHNGEFSYAIGVDVDGNPNNGAEYDVGRIFRNNDVAFHNEIWSSAFFGNFASGTTYGWEPIFWWEDKLPVPPIDNNPLTGNQYQPLGIFSKIRGVTNLLDIGIGVGYPVENKPIYHNFKPLSDMLSNIDWQSYDFFNSNFTAHKVYNEADELECYYLMNADSNLAIGWVHNMNAFWWHQYYAKRLVQHFLDCADPNAQSINLPGFQSGVPFHITYFPTRIDTICPPAKVDSSGTGNVLLDVSLQPFNGVLNNYLDTTHADYGFIISPQPVHRSLRLPTEPITVPMPLDWNVHLFPNPAHDLVNVLFSDGADLKDLAMYDATGKCVYSQNQVTGPRAMIPTLGLARGVYCVRATGSGQVRARTLILQ